MSETKEKPCMQSASLLTLGPARSISSPIPVLKLGGYVLDFYVKRDVRVSHEVSPNGGRETSGDDGEIFKQLSTNGTNPTFSKLRCC